MKKNYSRKEMKRILKKEIELSNIVNQKIDDAFEQIKPDYQRSRENDGIIPYRRKIYWKTSVVAIGVLILVCAGITGVAYSIGNWHPIMTWLFGADEQMQEKMDQIGLSDKPEANIASFDNINVEMVQSIADSRFFYLLLKVTATDGTVFPFKEADIPKEAKEIMGIVYETSPSIGDATMVVGEGREEISTNIPKIYPAEDEHSFYCEFLGRYYEDKADINEQTVSFTLKNIFPEGDKVRKWENQIMKQAGLEALGESEGYFRDDIDWEEWSKKIPKPEEIKREGEWKLTWEMKTTDKKICIKDWELPQYGTVMRNIEISPISLLMEYDWSLFERYGVTEYQYFETPFLPTHFRMKDGTIIESGFIIAEGPGYKDEEMTKADMLVRLEKIIDVDNIQSVILTYTRDQSQVEIPVE